MSSIMITILTPKIGHASTQIALTQSISFQIIRLLVPFMEANKTLEDSLMIQNGRTVFALTSWGSAKTRRKGRYIKLDG